MEITIVKVKQYNGPRYHVLSVDGIPVAVTKRRGRAIVDREIPRLSNNGCNQRRTKRKSETK